ncbi:MAG: AAA family ATPase, partial [Gammaproteobacteria bacterium]
QPEQRYQSAGAVREDLIAARATRSRGAFPLGRTDSPRLLAMPKRLYGRDHLLERLFAVEQRVAAGEALLVEVVGAHASGKRSVQDTLMRHARDGGFLVARIDGRTAGDRNGAELWLDLLRQIVRHALASNRPECLQLPERIAALPAGHRAALARHLPELEHRLTGREAPALPLVETVGALMRACQSLSMALVVDDADALTEAQLRVLLDTASSGRRVLLALSQTAPDPLIAAEPCFSTKRTLLELAPLARSDVRKLLADMLSEGEIRVRELAHLLHEKSGGYPGHLRELIQELHAAGAIAWSPEHSAWTWDLPTIERHYFSNTTAARVRAQIQGLPAVTRTALAGAAAIGDSFDIALLSAISDVGQAETLAALRPAIAQGLLRVTHHTPLDVEQYRFTHAHIRRDLYRGIDSDRRCVIHERIAEAQGAGRSSDDATVQDIAEHLNAAIDLVHATPAARLHAGYHNLLASRAALRQQRWQQAYKFARSGLALRPTTIGTPASTADRAAMTRAEA